MKSTITVLLCSLLWIGGLHASSWAQTPSSQAPAFKVETLASNLERPWALAFLSDGRMLVTEKQGTIKLLASNGQTIGALSGVQPVNSAGQGGLLDIVLDPAFASNQRIYFAFSENDAQQAGVSGTAVARARLHLPAMQLQEVNVIFRQLPKVNSSGHFGARLVFDQQGHLFVTLGDRQARSQRGFAQDLRYGHGKVMRITTDGKPAPGNPVWTTAGAQASIWSYGHRNPQGAALDAQGRLWVSEHGPQGGDEINLVQAGKNYGWPLASHGQEYGTPIPVGEPERTGTEQPVVLWLTRDGSPLNGIFKSSTAPSGLVVYSGDKFPEFRGNLFSGSLAGMALWRIVLSADGRREVQRERMLADLGERIRDVRQGPDGWLYLLTDSGKLLRLSR